MGKTTHGALTKQVLPYVGSSVVLFHAYSKISYKKLEMAECGRTFALGGPELKFPEPAINAGHTCAHVGGWL